MAPETLDARGAASSSATAARLVKVTGALRDRFGQPLTGTIGVAVGIYKEQQGGTPLWVETQNVLLDAQGNYSMLLGSMQSEGLPLDLFTTGESRWLGVQAQLPGESEQPRLLLVSVPYALKAADAETLGGKPLSAFVLASPADNTGEESSSTLDSGKRIVNHVAANIALNGAAIQAASYLAEFNPACNKGCGSSLVNSPLFDSGGNLGLGTLTPGAKLDVNGIVKATGFWGDGTSLTNLQASSLTGGISVQVNGTSPNIVDGYSGNTVNGGVVGATISGGGAASYASRASDDFGTVGGGMHNQAGDNLGTTSDQAYATVGGGGNNTASGHAATVGGGLSNTASNESAIVAGGQSNTASGSYATVGGGGVNNASQTNATVGGGGNNTASGAYATVSGGQSNTANNSWATVPGGLSNTAGGFYSLAAGRRAKANHLGAFVWGDSTDADVASTANNQFLIRASGGVGIGTASPVSALHVRKDAAGSLGAVATIMNGLGGLGAGAALDLDTYDPGVNPPSARLETLDDGNFGSHFVFLSKTPGAVTNSLAERMRITDTGSVGIGTSAPLHKLEISGGDNDMVYLSSSNAGLELRSSGANNSVYIDLTDGSTSTAGSGTPDFDYRILYTGETTNQLQIASDTTNPIMTFVNSGKVGIGTTAPGAKLHVSGPETTTHGSTAGVSISNTASGGGNWVLRAGATGTATPAGGFSIADDVGYRLMIDSSGNVGIAATPEEKLTVLGNVKIKCCYSLSLEGGNIANNGLIYTQGIQSSGDVCAPNVLCFSSRRFKTDIQTLEGSLAKVQRLRGVSFNWKETQKHDIGMIAEEVAEIVPEVVRYEPDGVTAKGMDYARLTAVLIEAVKEQQAQIRQLQAEVEQIRDSQSTRPEISALPPVR